MNWIDSEFVASVADLCATLPALSLAGFALGLAFSVLSYARDQRDLRVLAFCAFAYGLMPVLPMV